MERLDGASYFTQLSATVRRQLIQKRRMWKSLLLEMLLPVAFVVGLLGISLASDTKKIPPRQYVSSNGPLLFGEQLRAEFLCHSTASAHPDLAALLDPCPAAANCFPTSAYLPLEGLCLRPSTMPAFLPFARQVLDAERDVEVPNYDDYVLFKWVMTTILPDSDDLFGESIGRARQTGNVYVAPPSAVGQQFVEFMNTTHRLFKHSFGGYFSSRAEAVPWLKQKEHEGMAWALYDIASVGPEGLSYTLSMNRTAQVPTYSTTGVRSDMPVGLGEKSYARYVVSGAITLQKSINDFYVTEVLGSNPPDIYPSGTRSHLVVTPMPTDTYNDDEFLQIGGQLGPLLLVLAFLYPVSQLSKRLVEEKEQRLREGTMIMGLSKAALLRFIGFERGFCWGREKEKFLYLLF